MKPSVSKMRTPNANRPKGARNKFFLAEKAQRRVEAEERNAKYQALTPAQRLARLDTAFGKGVGAKRERARIAKLAQSPAHMAAVINKALNTLTPPEQIGTEIGKTVLAGLAPLNTKALKKGKRAA